MSSDTVSFSVDGRALRIEGHPDLHDRRSRRFFKTVLGGERTSTGWLVAARASPMSQLVLRVDAYINDRKWVADRDELVTRDVELALERQRSFERTRSAARAWKEGDVAVTVSEVEATLKRSGWKSRRALRTHQQRDATHALAATNAANFSVPGSGKTTTALAVATMHLAAGTVDAVLVVGPLASFEPWEVETEAALGTQLTVTRVRGSASRRRATYAAAQPEGVLLVGYQAATADQQPISDLAERLNLMLVVDESHRAKRFRGGSWAPALVAIAKRCRIRMILSGTPMPRSPLDLYSQLNILWPDGQLTGTADSFAQRAENDFSALRDEIAPFTTRTAKAELGLPPYEVHYHDVELEGTQREIYELIAGGFRREVEDAPSWEEKIEALRRARPIRLLQAATNPSLLNQRDEYFNAPPVRSDSPTLMERLARYGETDVPAKYELATGLVQDIVEDGRKVVCWSNFVANLDNWRTHLAESLGVATFQIDGRVPVDDGTGSGKFDDLDETRESILHDFLTHDGPAVFITNPASCSESISLHHACHDAIYLDRTYDAALYLQSIDRVHRLGLDPEAQVQIHLVLARHDGLASIDHLVEASLREKQAAMEEVLEGAQLHPSSYVSSRPEGSDDDLRSLVRYLVGETGS